jgi:hypothetical protein
MSLPSLGHAPTIVDLLDSNPALAEVSREAHRTTPKGPPPRIAPRRRTAAATCTPNKRSAAPDPGSPRQLKRVGASLHPPPHTTPRTHHLKAHGASPLLTLDSPRIRVCFAIGSAISPPSHSKDFTFAVPPPESHLHHKCELKATRDTARHLCLGQIGTSTLATTPSAQSDWVVDLSLSTHCWSDWADTRATHRQPPTLPPPQPTSHHLPWLPAPPAATPTLSQAQPGLEKRRLRRERRQRRHRRSSKAGQGFHLKTPRASRHGGSTMAPLAG